jgi:hypothetical protein
MESLYLRLLSLGYIFLISHVFSILLSYLHSKPSIFSATITMAYMVILILKCAQLGVVFLYPKIKLEIE